jgi:hypothetical protein
MEARKFDRRQDVEGEIPSCEKRWLEPSDEATDFSPIPAAIPTHLHGFCADASGGRWLVLRLVLNE